VGKRVQVGVRQARTPLKLGDGHSLLVEHARYVVHDHAD
jgi:hypothetical protein